MSYHCESVGFVNHSVKVKGVDLPRPTQQQQDSIYLYHPFYFDERWKTFYPHRSNPGFQGHVSEVIGSLRRDEQKWQAWGNMPYQDLGAVYPDVETVAMDNRGVFSYMSHDVTTTSPYIAH
jgi:hypothetical protein